MLVIAQIQGSGLDRGRDEALVCPTPHLRTGRADFPHPALQLASPCMGEVLAHFAGLAAAPWVIVIKEINPRSANQALG